jgi:hypothetical protein
MEMQNIGQRAEARSEEARSEAAARKHKHKHARLIDREQNRVGIANRETPPPTNPRAHIIVVAREVTLRGVDYYSGERERERETN